MALKYEMFSISKCGGEIVVEHSILHLLGSNYLK